jgi:glycerol-3-phosphate dehydrogenase
MDRFVAAVQAAGGIERQRAASLVNRYGTHARALAERFAADGDTPLRHAPDHSVAEIRYLCRDTGVAHLADLVIRRTLLAINGQVTDALLAELADIAGAALGWDAARCRRELLACAALLRERHGVALAAHDLPHRRAPAFDASWPSNPLSNAVPT